MEDGPCGTEGTASIEEGLGLGGAPEGRSVWCSGWDRQVRRLAR